MKKSKYSSIEQFDSVEVNVWVPGGRLVLGSSEKVDNIDFDRVSDVLLGFSNVASFVGSSSVILGQSVDFGRKQSVDFGRGE